MKLFFLLVTLSLISCNPMEKNNLSSNKSAASNVIAPSIWPSEAFPINLQISNDFDSNETSAIQEMANAWSSSVNNQQNFLATNNFTAPKVGDLDSYEDSIIGIYKLTDWPVDLPSSALAVTQIFGLRRNIGRSNEYILIQHADILVNYETFTFSLNSSWGYDFKTVILHEIGHLLGLYHEETSVEDSVMYPTITSFGENRSPLPTDISNIASKYSLTSPSASSLAIRSIASIKSNYVENNQDNLEASDKGERVIIQFEVMPNGKENVRLIRE